MGKSQYAFLNLLPKMGKILLTFHTGAYIIFIKGGCIKIDYIRKAY